MMRANFEIQLWDIFPWRWFILKVVSYINKSYSFQVDEVEHPKCVNLFWSREIKCSKIWYDWTAKDAKDTKVRDCERFFSVVAFILSQLGCSRWTTWQNISYIALRSLIHPDICPVSTMIVNLFIRILNI